MPAPVVGRGLKVNGENLEVYNEFLIIATVKPQMFTEPLELFNVFDA